MSEHKKHNDIPRASFGKFGRNEFAIHGTTCDIVKQIAATIAAALSPMYKCVYVDAAHIKEGEEQPEDYFFASFTEYAGSKEISLGKRFTQYDYHAFFNEADIIIVNGNHFEAAKQIVVIDAIKEVSLKKKIQKYNSVELLLLRDNVQDIFPFVKDALPGWQQLPLYHLNDTGKMVSFFETQMQRAISALNGLVLAGGKSIRMGVDKSKIYWHGKEQSLYVADMLQKFCNEVYISCRNGQEETINEKYKTIADTFIGIGPMGGLLSAFCKAPDSAWLVVACDLPLVDEQLITHLISKRNISCIASAYQSNENEMPEPLIAIWEPKAYPVLLQFLSQGITCPRKVLMNNEINLVQTEHPEKLTNVNTEADKAMIEKYLPAHI